MAKKIDKKVKSTFEEYMESKTSEEKQLYQEGYKEFLASEMLLAVMEEANEANKNK